MIAAAVAAVALTRGPVAESVTQRSAVVSFRTAAPERAFVILQNGARVEAGNGVDHVARLTRLTPGRRYAYTVRTGAGVVARGSFRAAPDRGSRFTFAVVGDFGSGTRNETAVASLIESWRPDFVLTVGDNAYPQGSAGLLDRDVFRPYAAVMRRSAWFPALGNHDVKADGGRPELAAFHSLGNERWYRFTWGSAGFVVLDSTSPVAAGSPQLRFARSAPKLPSTTRADGIVSRSASSSSCAPPVPTATYSTPWRGRLRAYACRWPSKTTCTLFSSTSGTTCRRRPGERRFPGGSHGG